MSIFRADLYLRIKITNFNLIDSTQKLFTILNNTPFLRNIQMTKVRQDKEEHGRMSIKEWYEITGSIDVPEGSKSFWVLSKEITQDEPFNFFMRIDRNIEAADYNTAQKKTINWINENLIESIKKSITIERVELDTPVNLRKTVYLMRESC